MIKTIIGTGNPVIGIVGCLHGDETCGLAAINALKDTKPKGTLKLIVANPEALSVQKWFINKDLNACFPGNSTGDFEDRLAHEIHNELQDCKYVIDLHACTAFSEPFAITTKQSETHNHLARCSGVKNLVIMSENLKQNKALIDHHPSAISIECGRKTDEQSHKNAIDVVMNVLRNLGLLEGQGHISNPDQYKVQSIVRIPEKTFELSEKIRNFQMLKERELIGKGQLTTLHAQEDCYPVLFNEAGYMKQGIIGLLAKKCT